MATVEYDLDEGAIVMTFTSKCAGCGHETDSYQEVRAHVDANPGHYFTPILR